MTEPFLEDCFHPFVVGKAADFQIGPSVEDVFRRDFVHIVHRPTYRAVKLIAASPSEGRVATNHLMKFQAALLESLSK